MNGQSKHQKRSRNTPGWLSQDYSAIVLVSSAIPRRWAPLPTPDKSGNYNLECVSPDFIFFRDKHYSDVFKYVLIVLIRFVSKLKTLISLKWVIGYSVARTSIARLHSNQRHVT